MANYSSVALRVDKMVNKKGRKITKVDQGLIDCLINTCANGDGSVSFENGSPLIYLHGRYSYDYHINHESMAKVVKRAHDIGLQNLILRYIEIEEGSFFVAVSEMDFKLTDTHARVMLSSHTWDADDFLLEFSGTSFPDEEDYEDDEDEFYDLFSQTWDTVDFHLTENFLHASNVPVDSLISKSIPYE